MHEVNVEYFCVAETVIKYNGLLPKVNLWDRFQLLEPCVDCDNCLSYQYQGDFFHGVEFLSPEHRDHILKNGEAVLFADQNWEHADLYAESYDQASPLLILYLYSYLATRSTLLLHSSLVDYKGSGIMFLGPSGIGKTTQAELWNRYLGADILNGDMVFVRQKPDGFYGYGSPWHGSSPYCMNARVKLCALVLLSQGEDNVLTLPSSGETLTDMMNQLYLPGWDYAAADGVLTTLDALLQQLPVYRLSCRPDQDAVELLRRELQL